MAAGTSSLQVWLQDPKNKKIAIGGLAGLVLIIVLVVVFMMMSGPGDAGTGTETAGDAGAMPGMAPGGSGAPGMPGMPGDPATMGADPAAMGGVPAQPGAAGGGEDKVKKLASGAVPHRDDPFVYNRELNQLYTEMTPLPTAPEIYAPAHVSQWYELYKPPKTPPGQEGNEMEPAFPVPPMRVAGVQHGSAVAAMLEVNMQPPIIVRPGQMVLNEFRVDKVERDRVLLSRKVPGYKKRQRIEVTMDGPSAIDQMGGGVPGMPGAPGMPGMPGSTGLPGGPFGGGSGAPGLPR
jgi:hypothetical protein